MAFYAIRSGDDPKAYSYVHPIKIPRDMMGPSTSYMHTIYEDISLTASANITIQKLFNNPNDSTITVDDIKAIATLNHYTDKSGLQWNIYSDNIDRLKEPLLTKTSSHSTRTNSYSYELHFYRFYWVKQKDYAYIRRDFGFNNSIISFIHRHDLRTKVLTLRGKLTDLSKYTKNLLA